MKSAVLFLPSPLDWMRAVRSETFVGIAPSVRRRGGSKARNPPLGQDPFPGARPRVPRRAGRGTVVRFDESSRGDATRTGMKSAVLFLPSPLDWMRAVRSETFVRIAPSIRRRGGSEAWIPPLGQNPFPAARPRVPRRAGRGTVIRFDGRSRGDGTRARGYISGVL